MAALTLAKAYARGREYLYLIVLVSKVDLFGTENLFSNP